MSDLETHGPWGKIPPRYRVERILSRRGQGATLEVFDGGLRQQKAVIRLDPLQASTDIRARFQQLCEAFAVVRDPHVCPPYTYGFLSSSSGVDFGYSTRPYVHGTPLSGLRVPMSLRDVIQVAAQLCAGLDALHQLGLYHSDVKPENVIVRRAPSGHIDNLSECVLIDLSHAPVNAGDGDVASEVTVQYAAPELLEGCIADSRTDLYALGALIYRLLTGVLPFPGSSLPEIIHNQRTHAVVPLSAIRADLPSFVETMVGALLEPNPNNRPQTANEVLATVRACGNSEWLVDHSPISWGFVGREKELDAALEAIGLEEHVEGVSALEITGPPGSGVSTVLRELQDRTEACGAAVLTVTPRALSGTSIIAQLRDPVAVLV